MLRFSFILALTLAGAAAHAAGFGVPETPPGVTVEPAQHLTAMANGIPNTNTAGTFADANGMALYTFAGDTTPGQSACVGDCATAWPALAAPADATPVGDWSIVARADGTRQWAFRGKPLYRFAKDTKPGEVNGKGADSGQWQTALPCCRNRPMRCRRPAAVTLRSVSKALGDIFVDRRGMTLYTFDTGRRGPGQIRLRRTIARRSGRR